MHEHPDKLVLVNNGIDQEVCFLDTDTLTIGRQEKNTIVLHDNKVSRLHARLQHEHDGWFLTDNNSSNGIYVNGVQVTRVRLSHGDVITLGNSTLRFETGVEPPAPAQVAHLPQAPMAPDNECDDLEQLPPSAEHPPEVIVGHQNQDQARPLGVPEAAADAPEAADDAAKQTAGRESADASQQQNPKEGEKRKLDKLFVQDFLSDLEQTSLPNVTARVPLSLACHVPNLGKPCIVIHTEQKIWQVLLSDKQSWSIGRDPQSDIWIDHEKVSRHHARIERQGDTFLLRDLDSVNGVWKGGQRIHEYTLKNTDVILVGDAYLIFKEGAGREDDHARRRTTNRPVVILPGSMGSELWRGSERVWPNVRRLLMNPRLLFLPEDEPLEPRGLVGEVVVVPKVVTLEQYNRLGNYLEASLHYQHGKDLLEFAYDWRQDMRSTARLLARTLDSWDVTEPITIIAHSQGCLISRYYVECLGGKNKVGRLILIGGPNKGAPNAILNLMPAHLANLMNMSSSLGGSIGQMLRDMNLSFPSMYAFFPTYPAIFDQHGQVIDLYQDTTWLPAGNRALVNDAHAFVSSIPSHSSVPTVCIFGYGHKTIVRIEIERDARGRWRDLNIVQEKDGDGTVPSASAIVDGAEIHPVQQDHNSLYVDEDVMMRLKFELTRSTP